MQKWAAIIYLFLTLLCSFYPCCQDDDCTDEIRSEQAGAGTNDQGFCLPLSTCASCMPSVDIAAATPVTATPSLQRAIQNGGYINSGGQDVYSSLFQPPRSC